MSFVTGGSGHRRLLWFVCVVASTALAAACGSSSSSSSSAPGASGSTPPSVTTSPPSSSSSGGGGVSDSAFCDLAKKWKAQEPKEIQSLTSLETGASLKAVWTKLGQDYAKVIAIAPSDIKPSLEVLYGDFQKLNTILAQHNYNLAQAGPEIEAHRSLFQNAQTKQAIAKLDAWGKANSCHM